KILCSLEFPEANTVFAGSLKPMTGRQERASGASPPSLAPANRATKLGKAIRGKLAARRLGLQVHMMQRRTRRFGPPAILRLRIAAKGVAATISTAIRCSR